MNTAIQSIWPVQIAGKTLPYEQFVAAARDWLERVDVPTRQFSHVGIVVRDVKEALRDLAARVDPAWGKVQAVWGEAFGCHIARHVQDGAEYEFIEPVRESFLRSFLVQDGPGVHHLSFEVEDLNRSLDRLRSRGVPMADPVVRQGLHGLIAFVAPGRWGARCLELCQVVEHEPANRRHIVATRSLRERNGFAVPGGTASGSAPCAC